MFVSKRLNTIVDLIKYETIGDIACDHGFISILACENKGVKKSIACDLNKEPLQKCVENSKEYGFLDKIITREVDGIKGLEAGEVDTIIIAGLGGILMKKILSENENVFKSSKQLILQPQSDVVLMREYMVGAYFTVMEQYVEDKGKFYVILNCEKADIPLEYNESELILGKNILYNEDFSNFVKHKIFEFEKIQSKIHKNSSKYIEIEKQKNIFKGVLNDNV
ncbi:MAG: tRNA (adenine(22)-N(1))-methyltransferase [Lachnospirales bacterium]